VRDGRTITFQLVDRLSQDFSASLCFSRDGHWLAWVHADWGQEKHRVHVWDLRRSQLHALSVARIRYGAEMANVMGFCPDSPQLVFVSDNSAITVWDLISNQVLQAFGEEQLERRGISHPGTHLSADGAWYALGDRAVTVWDLKARRLLATLSSERSSVCSLGWSPDRNLLAVGDFDGGLEIWNLPKIHAKLTAIGLGW
jgi:WD40 repeat protein